MTAQEFAPYLGLIGILLAAAVAYALNVRLERRKSWELQERSKAYSAFIESVGAIALVQNAIRRIHLELRSAEPAERPGIIDELYAAERRETEKSGDMASAKARIAIYGSAAVVERLVIFWSNGAALDTPERMARFIEVLVAMRRETVGLASLQADHFETLLFGG